MTTFWRDDSAVARPFLSLGGGRPRVGAGPGTAVVCVACALAPSRGLCFLWGVGAPAWGRGRGPLLCAWPVPWRRRAACAFSGGWAPPRGGGAGDRCCVRGLCPGAVARLARCVSQQGRPVGAGLAAS